MKIQDAFREYFPGAWVTGESVCYNNSSRTKTKIRRNFKFDFVILPDIKKGETQETHEEEFKKFLVQRGFNVSLIGYYPKSGSVQVWLNPEDIVKEGASFSVDWKANPEKVIKEVNEILKSQGVAFKFAPKADSDDQCHFEIKKA